MNVHEVSPEVEAMRAASKRITDISAGGPVMRAAGAEYLPKFAVERDDDHKARIKLTWLFDGVGKAIEDTVGRIFDKPVELKEKEGEIYEWSQNVDLEGRDLSVFARSVMEDATKRGVSFIMVDAPRREDGPITKGEAKAQNLRPFLVHLTLDDILGWKWTAITNAPTLTQLRIMESAVTEEGEFGDKREDQIRVLELREGRVFVRIFRKSKDKADKDQFIEVDEYPTDMTAILVAPVYTERTAFMLAKPPLDRLAELNVAHWQTQSDKASCLHKSLTPLLMLKGMGQVGEDGAVAVKSADYGFTSEAEHADMKWVEISGSGIERAEKQLENLEQQMRWQGLALMMERASGTTATGEANDEKKATSKLAMWADGLKDALELVLGWMADLGGLGNVDTTVVVNTEFGSLAGVTMADVRDMYNAGVITKQTYILEAQRRGVISPDIDPNDEAELSEVIVDRPVPDGAV